jgi:hypothetical protein
MPKRPFYLPGSQSAMEEMELDGGRNDLWRKKAIDCIPVECEVGPLFAGCSLGCCTPAFEGTDGKTRVFGRRRRPSTPRRPVVRDTRWLAIGCSATSVCWNSHSDRPPSVGSQVQPMDLQSNCLQNCWFERLRRLRRRRPFKHVPFG